jgi:uroporphyrinogen decarboxylase
VIEWSGGKLPILGSIPPRDVLAVATPAEIAKAVAEQKASLPPNARVMHSCAGGVPPGVPSANIQAFLDAI